MSGGAKRKGWYRGRNFSSANSALLKGMAMASEWYFEVTGKQIGPVSSGGLLALARRGTVTYDTPVRKGPDGKWVPAKRVKGLFPSVRGGGDGIPDAPNSGAATKPRLADDSGKSALREDLRFLLFGREQRPASQRESQPERAKFPPVVDSQTVPRTTSDVSCGIICCYVCQKDVAANAPACPRCGAIQTPEGRELGRRAKNQQQIFVGILTTIFVVPFLILFLSILFAASSSKTNVDSSPTRSYTPIITGDYKTDQILQKKDGDLTDAERAQKHAFLDTVILKEDLKRLEDAP
jgi:hypothetical protein